MMRIEDITVLEEEVKSLMQEQDVDSCSDPIDVVESCLWGLIHYLNDNECAFYPKEINRTIPFDVDKAKAGAKVIDIEGHPVRIVDYNFKINGRSCVLGIVSGTDKNDWTTINEFDGAYVCGTAILINEKAEPKYKWLVIFYNSVDVSDFKIMASFDNEVSADSYLKNYPSNNADYKYIKVKVRVD